MITGVWRGLLTWKVQLTRLHQSQLQPQLDLHARRETSEILRVDFHDFFFLFSRNFIHYSSLIIIIKQPSSSRNSNQSHQASRKDRLWQSNSRKGDRRSRLSPLDSVENRRHEQRSVLRHSALFMLAQLRLLLRFHFFSFAFLERRKRVFYFAPFRGLFCVLKNHKILYGPRHGLLIIV